MRCKYIIVFLVGALLGGIDGGLHGQQWNKPIHYSAMITFIGVFPLLYLLLSLTERSLKELIKLIIISQTGCVLGWSVSHFLVYKWFFDDPILMLPIFVLYYSAYSFVIHEIRFILPEQMKEKGLLAGLSATFGIMWGKVYSLIKPVRIYVKEKPGLMKRLVCYVILLLVLYFGSFGIGFAVLKYSDKAQAIREGIGRQILFDYRYDNRDISGTLTQVEYQYEWGKPWVICFRIEIKYESQNDGITSSGNLSTILSPFELDRIEFVEKNE